MKSCVATVSIASATKASCEILNRGTPVQWVCVVMSEGKTPIPELNKHFLVDKYVCVGEANASSERKVGPRHFARSSRRASNVSVGGNRKRSHSFVVGVRVGMV